MAESRVDGVDLGRVAVVAMFVLSISCTAGRAWRVATSAGPPLRAGLDLSASLLTATFGVLVVAAYLRRRPAAATDRSPAVWLAAPVATCLPFVMPALPGRVGGGTARSALAFLLILAGTAWSVWSIGHLSTCVSVVPQARRLVDSGPYRFVRHPLYLGELVAVAGLAVRGCRWPHVLVVLALLVLQLYRAGREEALLTATVPGYAGYAARTWRILPGPRRPRPGQARPRGGAALGMPAGRGLT